MKRILIIVLPVLLLAGGSNAQNTWVRKLSYNTQMQGYSDILTGVKQIEVGLDGSVYLLANVNARNQQYIYKFFPNSNQVEWFTDAGYHHTGGPRWTDRFKTTSDSGIVSCYNRFYSIDPTTGGIMKYDKSGALEWQHEFHPDFNTMTDNTAYDAIETSSGKYYVLTEDSMHVLDSAGNEIYSTNTIFGRKILEMTNGDLLIYKANNWLYRVDTLGNTIWTTSCNGLFAYDTSHVFVTHSGSYVKKIDALAGAQLWNRDYNQIPFSEIEATHDGGFMVSVGYKASGPGASGGVASAGIIIRADSMGDTLWTRTYPFPHFGLSTFKILPGGNIMTGGSYLTGYSYLTYKDYSAFTCMMNADGSYPLQQIDYLSPIDSDNNHLRNFVDDALATMLALGQTGPARDTSIDGFGPVDPWRCERTDIAIDWPTASPGGINHKYADYEGNGLIDTNDIINYPYCYPDSLPLFYRLGKNDHSQNIEEFSLIPVNDTILAGDDALYYMIMGSPGNPVDSIYGFAFSYFINEYIWEHADSAAFYSTDLGTPGIDVWTYQAKASVTFGSQARTHTLMCRTDFQNATAVYDTLGIIRFRILYASSQYTAIIADFKAILVDGTEVIFNVSTGSIFIDSSYVSVNERENIEIKVSPNPAADFLNIHFSNSNFKNIVLFNSLGERVKQVISAEINSKISIADLPNGFYFGNIISENAVKNFSFVVHH